jgi:hypothetical protein
VAIEEQFAEAWLTADGEHKVLGYTLKPFSPWHKFLLGAIDSPFIQSTPTEVDFPSLVAAAQCCCLSYPQRFVYKKSRLRKLLNQIHMARHLASFNENIDRFQEYILDYCHFPELWDPPEESGGGGKKKNPPPDPLSTVMNMIKLGFSESESWDMPLGKAVWYQCAFASLEGGDVDFITDKERQIEKDLEKFNAGLHEYPPNPLMQDG